MSDPIRQSPVGKPLFRRVGRNGATLRVYLDGEPVDAFDGDTVASLLLTTIEPQHYRQSPASGGPRAPLCMMGVCFECLVEIDGQKNQQGCLVPLRDGMRIRRQFPSGPHP